MFASWLWIQPITELWVIWKSKWFSSVSSIVTSKDRVSCEVRWKQPVWGFCCLRGPNSASARGQANGFKANSLMAPTMLVYRVAYSFLGDTDL